VAVRQTLRGFGGCGVAEYKFCDDGTNFANGRTRLMPDPVTFRESSRVKRATYTILRYILDAAFVQHRSRIFPRDTSNGIVRASLIYS